MASGTTLLDSSSAFAMPRVPGLRDEVVLAIENAVLLGAITPGQRLVELEIARQMGISKAPVREALRELERLGLVVSFPRRGTFVAEITPTVASEAYSLRAVIESYAVRLAVSRHTEHDLASMEALLDEADSDALRGEAGLMRRAELHLAFHDEIYRLSGHRQLQDTWGNLRVRIHVLLVATGTIRHTELGPNLRHQYRQSHAPIVSALRARDADLAEVAVIAHLSAGERRLVEQLAGDTATLRVEVEALGRRPDLAVHLGHVSATNGSVAEVGISQST